MYRVYFLISILIFILLSGSGCQPAQGQEVGHSISSSPNSSVFQFRRVFWDQEYIYLLGSAAGVDGSKFQVRLYKDGRIAGWWPDNITAHVKDGRWEASIHAGSWKAPDILPEFEPGYSFRLYDPEKKDVKAEFAILDPSTAYTPVADLQKSQWKLVHLNGNFQILKPITAGFDTVNPRAVAGQSTVNSYGACYAADSPHNLFIFAMTMTCIGAADNLLQQEKEYFSCLRKAVTYEIVDGRLKMYDDQGSRLLAFERQ